MSLKLRSVVAGIVTAVSVAALSPAHADPMALAKKYNCLACHSVDHKIVGPAYKDVAAKYKDDPKALETLMKKVKEGGSGVWGQIPMPPNNVPDDDLKTLVEWVLSLK